MSRRRPGTCLYVLFVSWAGFGCAVDTDMPVCPPGMELLEGRCADVVVAPEVICIESITDAVDTSEGEAGAACQSWRDCTGQTFCGVPGPEDIRRCELRCDTPGAAPCADGDACSLAGLCLTVGAGGAGDACAADGCGPGLACASEDEQCHPVCDPRAALGCAVDEVCAPRLSGLGLCLPSC